MGIFWHRARYVLTVLFFTLLPWQTRLIYRMSPLGSEVEYGRLSLYASEIVLGFLVFGALVHSVQQWRHGARAFHPFTRERAWIVGMVAVLLYGIIRSLFTDDVWSGIQHTMWLLEATLVVTLLMGGWMPHKAALYGLVLGSAIAAVVGIVEVIAQYVPANKWFGLSEHIPAQGGTSVVETGPPETLRVSLRAGSTRFLRAYGPFPHPNIFGGYMVLGLLALVAVILSEAKNPIRLVLDSSARGLRMTYAVLVLFSAALALSFSRGALLAWVFTACLLFWRYRHMRIPIGVSFAAIAVIFFMLWPFTVARFSGVERLEKRSVEERITSIRDGMTVWKQAPWFGVGPAQFVNTFFPPKAGPASPDVQWWQWSPPHNVMIAALAEYGLVGVALLLMADGLLVVYLLRVAGRRVAFWFIPVVILMLFDHYFWSFYSGMMLFALFAGFCALSIHSNRTPDTQQAS